MTLLVLATAEDGLERRARQIRRTWRGMPGEGRARGGRASLRAGRAELIWRHTLPLFSAPPPVRLRALLRVLLFLGALSRVVPLPHLPRGDIAAWRVCAATARAPRRARLTVAQRSGLAGFRGRRPAKFAFVPASLIFIHLCFLRQSFGAVLRTLALRAFAGGKDGKTGCAAESQTRRWRRGRRK